MMAGSMLMLMIFLLIGAGMFVLYLTALISCLRNQQDRDRTTWVLVIIFVPLIGPILYFTMAPRHSSGAKATMAPPLITAQGSAAVGPAPDPAFDHQAMHDEKKRAAAIAQDLHAMMAAKRRSKP